MRSIAEALPLFYLYVSGEIISPIWPSTSWDRLSWIRMSKAFKDKNYGGPKCVDCLSNLCTMLSFLSIYLFIVTFFEV